MAIPVAIPIGMAVASAASKIFGGKKAQNAEDKRRAEAQSKLDAYGQEYSGFQKMLAQAFGINPETYTPFASGLAAQMSAPQITTTESSYNRSTTPTIQKQYKGGEDLLYSKGLQRVQRGSALPPGYATTQAQSINASAAPALAAEGNVAARHGLSRDQALIGSVAQRGANAQINQMKANLPLQERQLAIEDQNWLLNYLQGLRGSKETGSQYGKTTGPADYSALLGLYSGLAPKEPTVIT